MDFRQHRRISFWSYFDDFRSRQPHFFVATVNDNQLLLKNNQYYSETFFKYFRDYNVNCWQIKMSSLCYHGGGGTGVPWYLIFDFLGVWYLISDFLSQISNFVRTRDIWYLTLGGGGWGGGGGGIWYLFFLGGLISDIWSRSTHPYHVHKNCLNTI